MNFALACNKFPLSVRSSTRGHCIITLQFCTLTFALSVQSSFALSKLSSRLSSRETAHCRHYEKCFHTAIVAEAAWVHSDTNDSQNVPFPLSQNRYCSPNSLLPHSFLFPLLSWNFTLKVIFELLGNRFSFYSNNCAPLLLHSRERLRWMPTLWCELWHQLVGNLFEWQTAFRHQGVRE